MSQRALIVVRRNSDDADIDPAVGQWCKMYEVNLDGGTPSERRIADALALYIRETSAGREKLSGDVPTKTIRKWARENGYEVRDTGRIPDRVMEQYYAWGMAGGAPEQSGHREHTADDVNGATGPPTGLGAVIPISRNP